jgi:HupE / UreJ protein
LTAPARIVEPAIAATIVGLALFDVWMARKQTSPRVSRLALVFACSLIHGLGLGGALADLGISPAHQGATLLGFNLGIELGQLSVAALALLGFALLRQLFGGRSVQMASSVMTVVAVMAGGVWFVQRAIF